MVPPGQAYVTRYPERAMKVAVLIPCYNEEAAIATVVQDFRAVLPDAPIYVYDNNSRDQTAARAAAAGAVVRREARQGKGNVVRRMFADIEADIYVLVDGDDTYDASAAPRMIQHMMAEGADLLTARRVHSRADAYRPGHVFGNRMLTGLTSALFRVKLSDMLSGYRVFSRRFVKSFPFTAEGFAIETELTVHAVRLLMPMAEMDTRYKERPVGSVSKLNTWRDGFRILGTIAYLLREERPLVFFSAIFGALALASVLAGTPVVTEYLATGLVPRLPTAVLATGLMVLAFLSLACGLILDTVTRGRWEAKRMAYLAIPGPKALEEQSRT
ncbi:MAG: glycosyl transferase [Alphaproteobacteria bacterium 64-11]|nr:glycosyltransferase [Alphaproteobacteria bacterium]OJU08264.1 MAG: glycosyl transferase [Alphaproteobacteria bacterium 64-11]